MLPSIPTILTNVFEWPLRNKSVTCNQMVCSKYGFHSPNYRCCHNSNHTNNHVFLIHDWNCWQRTCYIQYTSMFIRKVIIPEYNQIVSESSMMGSCRQSVPELRLSVHGRRKDPEPPTDQNICEKLQEQYGLQPKWNTSDENKLCSVNCLWVKQLKDITKIAQGNSKFSQFGWDKTSKKRVHNSLRCHTTKD